MPATFFSTLFMFLLIKYVPSTNWKRFVLLGIVAGLAFSSKHIVIPRVGLLILLHIKKIKDCIIITTVAIISYLFVNFPKFLSLENVKLMLNANIQGGGIGIPAIIYGPIEIGKPYTYPWYILTYLGLGYTGVSVSPYSIPVIALVFYLYQRFSMGASVLKTNIYKILVSYIAFSVLPLILLPRNYWVPISRFPGVSGESNVLTKFFYPYYYVITIPAFSIFTAYLICVRKGICRFICQITQLKDSLLLRIFEILTMIFLLLSPFNFSANTIYPFWDFIFTLLVNVEKEEVLVRTISYYSILILTIILAFISLAALITTRRKIK
jgi:phosphatidylglycerophosphatase A